jgi:pilus assembly protein Flp/PilA
MEIRDWLELARIELRREEGQTMTEYGVLLALIAVIVIVALVILGPKIAAVFTNVSSHL